MEVSSLLVEGGDLTHRFFGSQKLPLLLPCPAKKNVSLCFDRSRKPEGVGRCALEGCWTRSVRARDAIESI